MTGGRRRATPLLAAGAVVLGLAGAAQGQGLAVEGEDAARILVPVGATVEPYRNAGYSLRVDDGEVRVRSEAQPLRSATPFVPPRGEAAADPVGRLARSLASGSRTEFEAVGKILGWVSREIRYVADRQAAQDAGAVLARRSGYCTGIARLSVALLRAVGVEAREVAGWVAGSGPRNEGAAYHRWIEVLYPDRGWVFSDPLSSHNWVPASYVRLASEQVDRDGLDGGLILERRDRVAAVDVWNEAASAVRACRNEARQRAGSLRVEVAGGDAGRLTLTGLGKRRTSPLQLGAAVFVGLEPGQYLLRVDLPGRPALLRSVRMHARVKSAIYFPPLRAGAVDAAAGAGGVEGSSR